MTCQTLMHGFPMRPVVSSINNIDKKTWVVEIRKDNIAVLTACKVCRYRISVYIFYVMGWNCEVKTIVDASVTHDNSPNLLGR